MDATAIASLATAGGTLVLAVASFGSTRSANRAARVSEAALRAGLRPVLFNARPDDPPQKVGFIDGHWVRLRDGLGAVQESDGNIYLAMPLRNVATGLAVIHGWRVTAQRASASDGMPPLEEFHRQTRDLYVPANDISFWQAALRDREDPLYAELLRTIGAGEPIAVDLLYGDHEGGQRTITRFSLAPRSHAVDGESWMWVCGVARHWNIDREDPR